MKTSKQCGVPLSNDTLNWEVTIRFSALNNANHYMLANEQTKPYIFSISLCPICKEDALNEIKEVMK